MSVARHHQPDARTLNNAGLHPPHQPPAPTSACPPLPAGAPNPPNLPRNKTATPQIAHKPS